MPATAKAAETLSVPADQFHESAAQAPDPTSPSRDEAHTPGPWRFTETHYAEPDRGVVGWTAIEAGDGQHYNADTGITVYCTGRDNVGGAERAANARLIAAAPDMLAALQKAFEVFGCKELDGVFAFCAAHGYRYSGPSINIDELRQAIAKATGAAS